MLFAMTGLVAGVMAGLQRLGWTQASTPVMADHGAIMVGGFLGTLITLEKIVPLGRKALYLIPAVSSCSVLFFFLDQNILACACLIIASISLALVFFSYWMRERDAAYAIMSIGAVCWFIGNFFLAETRFYPAAIPWWIAFALLVIVAERLELMKFLPVTNQQKKQLILLLSIYVASCVFSFHGPGTYGAALAFAGIALWLMRHDVVGINLKKQGLARYVGVALVSGYVSLLITALFMVLNPDAPLSYDVVVHGIFIGFVFSMIFAHGPIILPGVLGIHVKPYHPLFYLWLVLLHTSWLGRAVADIMLDLSIRKYSGLVSTIAILGYFASLVFVTVRTLRAKTI